MYTHFMQHLQSVTKGILKRVEEITGKSIQFMRDDNLAVLSTLQMARHGAEYHMLRYRPSNDPIDYFVAFQAGFVLRLFECDPSNRFDFLPDSDAGRRVEVLLKAGQALGTTDLEALPAFADRVAQWALMNLRSLPIGMRIDQWIAADYPELRELQHRGIAVQQQQSMDVLAFRVGKLTVPTTLLGTLAAYALFADRLMGSKTFAIPFEASGLLGHGEELLRIWDAVPHRPSQDCALVDQWAAASGMSGWYSWVPYQP
jgi:hypothetical protein